MTPDENLVEAADRVVNQIGTTRSAFARDALRVALTLVRAREMEQKHQEGSTKACRKTGAQRIGSRAGLGRVMQRGEVRSYKTSKPDKRRPVVILTRDSALEFLGEVTSRIRGIPSEVVLTEADRMPRDCAGIKNELMALQGVSGQRARTEVYRGLASGGLDGWITHIIDSRPLSLFLQTTCPYDSAIIVIIGLDSPTARRLILRNE